MKLEFRTNSSRIGGIAPWKFFFRQKACAHKITFLFRPHAFYQSGENCGQTTITLADIPSENSHHCSSKFHSCKINCSRSHRYLFQNADQILTNFFSEVAIKCHIYKKELLGISLKNKSLKSRQLLTFKEARTSWECEFGFS